MLRVDDNHNSNPCRELTYRLFAARLSSSDKHGGHAGAFGGSAGGDWTRLLYGYATGRSSSDPLHSLTEGAQRPLLTCRPRSLARAAHLAFSYWDVGWTGDVSSDRAFLYWSDDLGATWSASEQVTDNLAASPSSFPSLDHLSCLLVSSRVKLSTHLESPLTVRSPA